MDFNQIYRYGLLLCLSLGALVASFSFSVPSQYLEVHFLDVGQGDAVLIQTPDGYEVLVDGGALSGVVREVASEQSFADREIDVVIATHPDTDHVGGLVDILGRYKVDLILMTETEGDSPAAVAFSAAAADENAAIKIARAGQLIQIGASTTIEVLAPASDTTNWRANNASIIVRVVYGQTAFMLTGDAPLSVEDYLVGAFGADRLRANVLKLDRKSVV